MTITVKFPAALEADLRRHAEAQGTPTSLVVREAVAQYLARAQHAAPPSAALLGEDLFGRYGGPADLAAGRKAALAEVWGEKHADPARAAGDVAAAVSSASSSADRRAAPRRRRG